VAGLLLRASVRQHARFIRILSAYSSADALAYNVGPVSAPSTDDNGEHGRNSYEKSAIFEDAQITGEIFPGRNACRPGVDWRRVGDDGGHCYKRFVSSDTLSAGIILCVCACSRPKVFGVSVMA
jgi:hypothetical protein